ncbi:MULTISPECIES: cobaltochelatase subunit CobN [unclassified Tepidimonas]|uniref:cobaltochelatase subunit CobN n=1 Tax=unclassified Tepidimonas TaxID=2631705 RepID=UPI003C7B9C7C
MHLLATRAGGFIDDTSGAVVRLAQTPAPVVVLSAADTTLSLLASVLPKDYPEVRLANLMALRQPATVDLYVEDVLQHARAVIIDHLGAYHDWAYLVERCAALARQRGQWLAVFSGDGQDDPQLLAQGTVDWDDARTLWRALRYGGQANAARFWALIGQRALGLKEQPYTPPQPLPSIVEHQVADLPPVAPDAPQALLLFYRAHVQASNTGPFDALLRALHARGLRARAWAVDSLKNPQVRQRLHDLAEGGGVDLVLNATAFALGLEDGQTLAGDAPVLQLITAGVTRQHWNDDPHGLPPRDMAMQVVLPELDGRIATRAISFKAVQCHDPRTQIDLIRYAADTEAIDWVAELAWRWCRLRRLERSQVRLAVVLTDYPSDDARIGMALGLDVPASVVRMLQALHRNGYDLGDGPALPRDGDELMRWLRSGVTHAIDDNDARPAWQSLALTDYRRMLEAWPAPLVEALQQRWGAPERDPMARAGRLMIPGIRLGQVFIGLQPPRDPRQRRAAYHDAEQVPPHAHVGFYLWLREVWQVDAVVQVGTHGNLEWLPGKSVALGPMCWPQRLLGPLPHLYLYIVNDPGEGVQAKRRTQAVIIDHLMPPLADAQDSGTLLPLERMVEEYYDALTMDPPRARRLRQAIVDETLRLGVHEELGLQGDPRDAAVLAQWLQRLDAYLCEIKESQLRAGLHVWGTSPQGLTRAQTLLAFLRQPRGNRAQDDSLLRAMAQDLGLDGFDPLQADPAEPWRGPRPALLRAIDPGGPWRHAGHTRQRLHQLALAWLQDPALAERQAGPRAQQVLRWVWQYLAPRLDACGSNETTQLLRGLHGRFVPPGPSGAPSRGRIDALPTGRNFYASDPRSLPTPAAWDSGQRIAARLIERYAQDHGVFPSAIGLSLWGTTTLRTGGEDVATALALLGVRPRWDEGSGRVIEVEVLPASLRPYPRVDVTLRVSGLFRDAFAHLIDLLDTAVQAVAAIDPADEPDELNPVRVHVQREAQALLAQGLDPAQAQRQASWRLFGPRPGSYGAGIGEVAQTDAAFDRNALVRAYLGSGAYAYGRGAHGVAAPAAWERRLARLDLAAHIQDHREHDALDIDGFVEYLGGMAAAAQVLRGQAPAVYHADSSTTAVRVRPLREELARIVRARVTHPRWLQAMQAHGYAGAAEMAATLEHLLGWAALGQGVSAHQLDLVAETLLFNESNQSFLRQHNLPALRRMAQRLWQAIEQGLWTPPVALQQRLRQLQLELEESWEHPSI